MTAIEAFLWFCLGAYSLGFIFVAASLMDDGLDELNDVQREAMYAELEAQGIDPRPASTFENVMLAVFTAVFWPFLILL